MKKFFLNLFGHACDYRMTDVIMCAYKDGYIKMFFKETGQYPVGYNQVKDIQPKCTVCGKEL